MEGGRDGLESCAVMDKNYQCVSYIYDCYPITAYSRYFRLLWSTERKYLSEKGLWREQSV